MLDLHSHILPGIDDGAKTVNHSIKLLKQLKEQGVTTVVATPHFYPGSMDLDDFIKARNNAYNQVISSNQTFDINIILGAEVLYFGGIQAAEDIKKLTFGKSNYLLLELMGIKEIDKKVIDDIINLKENMNIIPIIAHIERYCRYKGFKNLLSLIERKEALCQINATYNFSFFQKRAVRSMLKMGMVDFIASDCHDPVNRPVWLSSAFEEIGRIYPAELKRIIEKTETLERELVGTDDKQNG